MTKAGQKVVAQGGGGPVVADDPPQKKFQAVRQELRGGMLERDDEIDMILTALVCREHVLLVGPPGTGKSMLADAIVDWMDGERFSLLLSRITVAEEVFGPISFKGLKNDEYRRVLDGKLPVADVAFLDEIFKSSSVILNSLLKILNERVYHNGKDTVQCPLQLCIGASNEWPNSEDGGKELGALFDRFLFRREIHPVAAVKSRKRLLWDQGLTISLSGRITPGEIKIASREAANRVRWSDDAKQRFETIIETLRNEGVRPGDRRLRKSVQAVQAFAWVRGDDVVDSDHLEILSHVLWDDPVEQPARTRDIVSKVAVPGGTVVNGFLIEVQELMDAFKPDDWSVREKTGRRLSEIKRKLKKVPGKRAIDAIEVVSEHQRTLLKSIDGDDEDDGLGPEWH